ncbi:MAG: hypothetical protein K6F88_00040 [Ruminococcus sp.]|nr:hypothetical protein [Ruminococcus sp.]
MKTLYTSPVITVEELTKIDVLCASTVVNTGDGHLSDDHYDNADQLYSTLGDFSNFM